MKVPFFLKNRIEDYEKDNFERRLAADNIYRGKILAIVIIVFESIFVIADIITSALKVDNRFWFNGYLIMYCLMILINVSYLIFMNRFKEVDRLPGRRLKLLISGIIVYETLIMCWGSVISLMDQKLYGELIAFMINMIICSVLCFLNNRQVLIPYSCSVLILVVGLPFFQNAKDILIGHYINLSIFIIISWVASRMIYMGYCADYRSSVLLRQSNNLLEKEMNENKEINMKLAIANLQLKRLALIDELTGVPNRRSFRNYIDLALNSYKKEKFVLSIMMIDIDYFKQFNDNYGHEEGDKALVAVANQINSVIRNPMEFFGRWGGEEFIYTVLNTDEEDIAIMADIIRKKVRELNIPHGFSETHSYISVSIGTSSTRVSSNEDVRKGIELADKAMYLAKKSGRNCVKNLEEDSPDSEFVFLSHR